MLNLLVLHSMLFINSMTVFSLFCIGSEKFSPSCIKHWTSCGMIVDVKLTSQFCLLEIKENLGMLLMNDAGLILIMTPSFEFVGCEEDFLY